MLQSLARRTRDTRRARGPRSPQALVEALEPRQLLTAYYGQSLSSYFPQVLLDNLGPPTGTVYADFGANAAGLGDLDGDGYGDFAISAPGRLHADGSTDIAGAVFIFSGKTGSVIRTLSDGVAGFGTSIANIGDLNGDGKADLAVGSANFDPTTPGGTSHAGRAYVYSGADGAALLTQDGTGPSDEFGYVVIGAGDLNSDGVNDLVVGAPGAGAGGEGRVYVFSGANAIPLLTLSGQAPGDRFGQGVFTSAALINPVSVFAAPLIWVGAPFNDTAAVDGGRVYAFNGITGAEVWHRELIEAGAQLGAALVAIQLTSSTSSPTVEVVAGGPGTDYNSSDTGLLADTGNVYLMTGSTGAGMAGASRPGVRLPGERYGSRLWLAGPADVLVWAPGRTGDAYVALPRGTVPPLAAPRDGRSFYLGDLDGDGNFDFAAQSEGATTARLISSRPVPARVDGANDALTFVYDNVSQGQGTAIVNGRATLYSQIPGMQADDTVQAVNDSFLIVVRSGQELVLIKNGIRTALHDAVVRVEAPQGVTPDYSAFNAFKLGNDGALLLWGVGTWLLKGGVLTYLWNGNPFDMNRSGVILGQTWSPKFGQFRDVIRTADGKVTDITIPYFLPQRLTDSGAVYGRSYGKNRVDVEILQNGVVTNLTANTSGFSVGSSYFGYSTLDFAGVDAQSSVVFTYRVVSKVNSFSTVYVCDPMEGAQPLKEISFGDPTPSGLSLDLPLTVGSNGTVLLEGTVIAPTADTTWWTSADGAPAASAAGSSLYSVTFNRDGQAVVLKRTGEEWSAVPIQGKLFNTRGAGNAAVRQVLITIDGAGSPHIFIVTPGGTYYVSGDTAGAFGRPVLIASPNPIVDHAAVMVDSAGHVRFCGVDAGGDLILYSQGASPNTWTTTNLTTDQIEVSGDTFVPVAGSLTAYPTLWNGLNIAYLDSSGTIQVAWWAPGMPTWRADSLSLDAGDTGTFHGTLVSYVTPWGGLNVAGTDATGNLVALWWAPDLAHWRSDRLVSGTPAQLDENTLTAYVTPWGGLNIAGLDKTTGKLTAYWWTPGMPTWAVNEFEISGAPSDLALTGNLSSAVSPSGDLFITAVAADHHLANIWLGAATNYLWTFEDVTLAV